MSDFEHDYPEYILEYLRQRQGYEEDDSSHDEEFLSMSPNDVFDEVCDWNGLVGYGYTIREWITDIYGIDFDEYSG